MNMRISKTNYYLDIAETVSERCTCLRRRYGAIIVKNDSIVSTGYNGAPRGRENCSDMGFCLRERMNIPHGERYELCRSIHAEQNAVISASREEMDGATMYMVCTDPESGAVVPGTSNCMMCRRVIINSGIKRVVIRDTRDEYREINVSDWIENYDSLPDEYKAERAADDKNGEHGGHCCSYCKGN